ncbi:hypothetical protein EA660_08505 [Pseudoxanthomonas winnipegensis]|jgi:hypothetical protein|uniref:Uncharacterized protein n=2 Tax=Pseudoxanthomonas winnipegensis TaxID=2480810 RepID=A0A4Q8LA16_9GAMM|nr:hypothetical protein EA660_08505 [Pseudoxanthomonas winnipegensis]
MRPRHLMLVLLPLAAGLPAAAHAEGWCLGKKIDNTRLVAHFKDTAGMSTQEIEMAYQAHLDRVAAQPGRVKWVMGGNVECGKGNDDRNNTMEGGNTGPTVMVPWQPGRADLEAGRAERARLEEEARAARAQPAAAVEPARDADTPPAPEQKVDKAKRLLKALTDRLPR